MNPLSVRYSIFKALTNTDDVADVQMVSPVPGHPVQLRIITEDDRSYTITVTED